MMCLKSFVPALFAFSVCIASQAFGHTCVHDDLYGRGKQDVVLTAAEQAARRISTANLNAPATRAKRTALAALDGTDVEWHSKRSLRQDAPAEAPEATATEASTAQPLRMHVEYQLTGAQAKLAAVLQEDVLPRATRALKRALWLKAPVQGLFTIPRPCVSEIVGSGLCVEAGMPCSDLLPDGVPDKLLGDIELCELSSGECETQAGGEGVGDTDFVVFVTAAASASCGGTTTAHATSCVHDDDNWYGLPKRPLVGFINFCPEAEDVEASEDRTAYLVDTAVHELIHTLFMSASLFDRFIGADVESVVTNGFVTSPAVKGAARSHFACEGANGAPLENGGSSATAGSHWETSSMQTELMTGAIGDGERPVLSNITLALAQDSGWYQANYDSAGFLRYGHHAGCDMLDGCGLADAEPAAAQYFCAAADSEAVCVSHETPGSCQVHAFSDCPVLQRFARADCKTAVNVYASFSDPTAVEDLGIHYGPSSICLPLPGASLQRAGVSRVFSGVPTMCMATQCRDDGLHVGIKDVGSEDWTYYKCPEGEYLAMDESAGFAPDVRFGPCPPEGEVCPYLGCPVNNGNMCSGVGTCYEAHCHCLVDRSGPDCSQLLCSSAADCEAGQFCSAAAECSWGTAPPPPPPAPPMDEPITSVPVVEYDPVRVVRVGYLQGCHFFLDSDASATLGIQEHSKATGSNGELGLYVPGASEVTESAVRQVDPADSGPATSSCIDSLTDKHDANMALLLSAAQGSPTSGSHVGLLSTVVFLTMQSTNATLDAASSAVAKSFGVPVAAIEGKDWLSIAVDSSSSVQARASALDVAEVTIPTITTAEIVASLVAGGQDGAARSAAADAFLLALTTAATPLQRLGHAEWLTTTMQSQAVSGAAAVASDAADAVAEALLLVNGQLAEVRARRGDDDVVALMEEWAKIAHVAEVVFASHAAGLHNESLSVAWFRSVTDEASLEQGKQGFDVDVNEVTLLEDPSALSDIKDGASEWLSSTQGPLKGWMWLLLAALLSTAGCCVCRTLIGRRQPTRQRNSHFDSGGRRRDYPSALDVQ